VNGKQADSINHEQPCKALFKSKVLFPIYTEVDSSLTGTVLRVPHTPVVCGQFMSAISGVVKERVESP